MEKWLRPFILLLFTLIAGWYSVVIPPGEGVDEIPHFDYVRYVKTEAQLPVQPLSLDEGVEVWMGHHPPLYYTLAAVAIAWADLSDFDAVFRPSPQFVWAENDGSNGWNVYLHFGQDAFPWRGAVLALHVVRFLTIAAGLVVVLATLRTADLMFPHRPWYAIGLASVVAFNPSFLFMSSTIHHDTLQAAIFAVALWWMVAFLQREKTRTRTYVAGGVLIGLALLTKLSGLSLALVMGLALVLKTLRRGYDWAWLLRRGALIFSVAGLMAGWWYLRNLILYGDPLGWEMFLTIHAHMLRDGGYTWRVFVDEFLGQIGRTYWGGFGYMHITFPRYSRYFWIISGAALPGFMVMLIRERRRFAERWAEWLVIFSILAVVLASFVRFSIATEGAGHGRYLFPAAFATSAIIVLGLNELLLQKGRPVVALAALLGLAGYAVWLPAAHVLPRYAPPESVAIDAVPDDAEWVQLPVAEGVQLAAFEIESARVAADATLPVTVYWRAAGLPEQRANPRVNFSLMDANENVVATETGWPVTGFSPSVWDPQQLYVGQWNLYVGPQELPESLYLTVTPVADPAASIEPLILQELVTTGTAVRVEPGALDNPQRAMFGSHTMLRGYQYAPEEVAPNGTVTIDLFWESLEPVTGNFTVFVHLLDAAGNLVAQHDRPAGGTTLPMTQWQPGEIIRDTYVISVPANAAPGTYSVRVGMYLWPSLERLPVTVEGETQRDAYDLFTLEIDAAD